MKDRQRPEERFRRVAVLAGIAIWLGLILVAVGLVFSANDSRRDASAHANAIALDESSTEETEEPEAAATPTSVPATATATPQPSATPVPPTATPVPSATATAVPTETPVPTPTLTPTPTPIPDPPTRIVAPAIGMDAPVIEVGWHEEVIEGQTMVVWDVADYAAGWNKTSARPGQGGNIVISGHHNIQGEVFRYIVDLQVGDEIILYTGDTPHTYYVAATMTLPEKGQPLDVRMENARWIMPSGDERVTLVTCWPYNNNTHRVIVVAMPTPGATATVPGG